MSTRAATLSRRARELPAGWWGMALLVATESTIFGSLIAAYFFIRAHAQAWPMGGIDAPEVLLPALLTAGLVATSVPIAAAASAARRGRTRVAWWAILIAVAAQCGYLAWQLVLLGDDLDAFAPSANAYASSYYALLGVHHAHVLVGILLGAWLLLRLALRGLNRYRVTAVRNVALYVHFVNVMAILVLLTALSPSL